MQMTGRGQEIINDIADKLFGCEDENGFTKAEEWIQEIGQDLYEKICQMG